MTLIDYTLLAVAAWFWITNFIAVIGLLIYNAHCPKTELELSDGFWRDTLIGFIFLWVVLWRVYY